MQKTKKTARKTFVIWEDTISYYNNEDVPKNLPIEKTEGELIKKTSDFVVLQNPKTKNYNAGNHRGIPEKNRKDRPIFLYIPRGMIKEIKEL